MSSEELIKSLARKAGIDLDRDVEVHDPRFWDRLLTGGSLALGESYVEGWWDPKNTSIDRLSETVSSAKLGDELKKTSWSLRLKLGMNWLYRKVFPNYSLDASKVVALQHYDLGNELYKEMLDTMVYSCAYFTSEDESLVQAQKNKMQLVNLKVKPSLPSNDGRILDIGCGWGELAAHLARENPTIRVDGITISKEQIDYCTEHNGSDRVKFFLTDYREWKPSYRYDAIVSVGMFEHVNPENYSEFMQICHSLLKPGGLFLLHTIGKIPSTITGAPWITKYIFPNSALPFVAQIASATEGSFVIEDVHNFGPQYDRTLMYWHRNFKKRINAINAQRRASGSEPLSSEFQRMWEYYLLMCAGVFRSRQCQLYQVVLSKSRKELYVRPTLE